MEVPAQKILFGLLLIQLKGRRNEDKRAKGPKDGHSSFQHSPTIIFLPVRTVFRPNVGSQNHLYPNHSYRGDRAKDGSSGLPRKFRYFFLILVLRDSFGKYYNTFTKVQWIPYLPKQPFSHNNITPFRKIVISNLISASDIYLRPFR